MRIPTREEQSRYVNLNAHDTQGFNVQERSPNALLQVNADMFGAGQARAMAQGAHELQSGARQIAHWYRENELTKATETFTKYQESLNEDLYGEKGIFTSKGEAALDAPKRANELLKKRAEEFSKQAGSDLGQEFFMQKAAGFNQQLMPRATLHAENERNTWMIATHSAAASNAINEAVKNYHNPEVFNQLMGEAAMNTSLAAQKQGLPPEAVQAKRDKAVSDGYMLVGQGLLAAGDVKGALGVLGSGKLDGQNEIRFKSAIKQEEKRMQAEARANAVLKMQDIRDSLQEQELMASQTGNITPLMESAAKLKALGNARGAAALLKKAEIYGNNYAAIEKVQSLPLPEGLKYIEDIDTKLQDASVRGDSTSYSALAHERTVVAKSLQGIVKGLQDDPAKAVSNIVIGDTPARIAESRMDAQSQHGLSLGARRVLTNAEATKFSAAWKDGDIQKKMSVVNALQEYGTYAGKAAQEAGIGAAEQLAMQNALDDPINIPHLQTIITASTAKSDALPILKDEKTLTASAVAESKIMKVYTKAARVMQGNISLQGNIRQMEKTMGNLLRMNGGDTDAALKAFDGTMDSVDDTNMSVAFNPKVVASGDIEKGLNDAMQGDLENFLTGRKYKTPYEKQDYLYHLRKSGMWVNAPDGKGYILIDPVSQAPVMREDGHTFRKTNADILHYKEGRQPMDPYAVDDMLMDTLP